MSGLQPQQRYQGLDNSAANNAKLLEDLGISQLGNNSLSDVQSLSDFPAPSFQSQEQLFHESLLQSIQELLASEAALEAQGDMLNSSQQQQQHAGSSSDSLTSALEGLRLSHEQQLVQQQAPPTGSLASTLPLETLEMLAASHLQLLVQQQAMLDQQQQQHGGLASSGLLNAQPAGHTNDGSLMFVTPQQSQLVGMPGGWVGHRVVALPGDNTKHHGIDLSSGLSGSSHQSNYSHQYLSVRSEDIMRHTLSSSSSQHRPGVPPAASWDHLSANSVPSLQPTMQPMMASSSTVRSADRLDMPNPRDLHNFPTVARRGGNRAYGPKSLRQREVTTFNNDRPGPGAPLRAAAPSWAGADWDPLRNAQNKAKLGGGTGVFLPPGTGVFLPVSEESVGSASPKSAAGGAAGASSSATVVSTKPKEASKLSPKAGINKAADHSESFDDLPASLMP